VVDRGLQGWSGDPFRLHEIRYFSDGRPTNLVRDGDRESYDEPPFGTSGNLLVGSTATQNQESPGWPGQQPPLRPPDGDYWPGLGALQDRQAPPPRRQGTRNTLFASIAGFAGLALLFAGVAIGAAVSTGSKPAPASTVTVTATAAPAAVAPAAVAPAAAVTVAATAAPAAAVTVTVTAQPSAAGTSQPSAAGTSQPAASSGVLINFSGSNVRNSAPFIVNSSAVTASYSYDCSGFGGTGTFIADMISGSPSSGPYDDQPIANELGSGGSQTTTVYPQYQGSSYHLEVNSDCSWSITLTAG
jgi:hypothetical protein